MPDERGEKGILLPTNDAAPRPGIWRRLAAVAALALVVVVVALAVVIVVNDPLAVVLQLALLLVVVLGVWDALTRTGGRRWAAALIAAAAIAAIIGLEIGLEGYVGLSLLLQLALLGVAIWLARYALARDVRTLKRSTTPGTPVPAAGRGALIMNLKSGGGKAERFHLEDECRARGIEPIILTWGDDLLQLARDAIGRGVDVIGMAGGDGSQALVASVAAERGIPMVVIPAGTRNHFALDLGLDRNDVVGALDAYGDAFEHAIDLGDVNGRVFVNNVSLGLYATIVRSPEYRDAKRETTLAALPQMLGPATKPFDLRYSTPDGVRHDGAHVIQVSNGPYGKSLSGVTSRPRIDTGLLGIFSLLLPDGRAATRAMAALVTSRRESCEGYDAWSAPTFELDSGAPIAVGLDGESLDMDPPLVFSSRPGVLRLRLPQQAIGYSPGARSTGARALLPDLWRTVLGRPIAIDD